MSDLWGPDARALARAESAALYRERARIADAAQLQRAAMDDLSRAPSRTKEQWECACGHRNNTSQGWCVECGEDREEKT
jgi:hypothetical protein